MWIRILQQRLCWPGRSGWRRILHPTTGSPARRDGSLGCLRLQPYFTVSPAACRRRWGLPAFYWVRFCWGYFIFSEKLSLSRPASITALLVLCALPINGFRNEGQMVPFVALLLFLFAEYYVFHGIFCFQYPVLPEIKRKPADDPEDLSGVAGIVCCRSFAELWRTEMSAGHHPATACSGSDRFIHGIRTPPAEAARWTLSCHSLCGKSCTCFSGILSVRRQRRLCSLSAAAGRGSRETASWGSGSPVGELWAGGKCKGRELCFSDAASYLGVPDPVGVWTLVCVPENTESTDRQKMH